MENSTNATLVADILFLGTPWMDCLLDHATEGHSPAAFSAGIIASAGRFARDGRVAEICSSAGSTLVLRDPSLSGGGCSGGFVSSTRKADHGEVVCDWCSRVLPGHQTDRAQMGALPVLAHLFGIFSAGGEAARYPKRALANDRSVAALSDKCANGNLRSGTTDGRSFAMILARGS